MKDTILIVDDEKILNLMNKILSKYYETLTAEDGAIGLKLFKENTNNIKLIVTDEQMPNMSGSQMLEEITKIKPNIPVIFVTGKNKIAYKGGYHMIKKPFNVVDLVNTVKTIMNNYQSGSGEYQQFTQ